MTRSTEFHVRFGFSVVLALLSALPATATAQMFVELGGGWNYVGPAPFLDGYSHGFNIRTSVGWKLFPHASLRIDAFTTQFDDSVGVVSPGGLRYDRLSARISGLNANWVYGIDSREIVYLIGGLGFYDSTGRPGRREDGLNVGLSAGGGIALPIGTRLRVFVEARDHVMLGRGSQPPWIVPLTAGVRF